MIPVPTIIMIAGAGIILGFSMGYAKGYGDGVDKEPQRIVIEFGKMPILEDLR